MLKLRHPPHPKVMRLLKVRRLLMPVSKEKRPLRKVMRLLKATLLKKWKKPLKKLLQKNAAGGANFALADSETERIKFVLNLFCFVLQGETFCLNLKLAIKNKTIFQFTGNQTKYLTMLYNAY